MSQQDYLDSVRNQDPFKYKNYSEELRANRHLGKN
jgi:hypothetical protein